MGREGARVGRDEDVIELAGLLIGDCDHAGLTEALYDG